MLVPGSGAETKNFRTEAAALPWMQQPGKSRKQNSSKPCNVTIFKKSTNQIKNEMPRPQVLGQWSPVHPPDVPAVIRVPGPRDCSLLAVCGGAGWCGPTWSSAL